MALFKHLCERLSDHFTKKVNGDDVVSGMPHVEMVWQRLSTTKKKAFLDGIRAEFAGKTIPEDKAAELVGKVYEDTLVKGDLQCIESMYAARAFPDTILNEALKCA